MENDKTEVVKAETNSEVLPKIEPVLYSKEELAYRSKLVTAMSQARDIRESPHPEFDDMTYTQYYDTNKRADMSYIPPKKNKVDKRIVTGYTREKDTTLLSALLSYNFQPDITVYDDTEMVFAELGNHFEDIVKKSRELELWENKRGLFYRELISQGNLFWEEIWECIYYPETDNSGDWKPGMKITEAKFENKLTARKMERAAVKMHLGKNVYLGNFFEQEDSKQELKFTYELLPRELAKAIYGTWDRWEHVPYEVDNTLVLANMGITYYDWNLTRTNKDYVGVLKIQLPFSNRYMIMLNGVMMLPIEFPLSEISPDGNATIHNNVLEAITGCAYGKGQPAKTKVDQAVHDEFLRLMIVREEQAGAPPMGYRGKRVLNPNIYQAGKITNNMKEGDLFPILPPSTGLGPADFSMYELIKKMMEDKTINSTFSGEPPKGNPTLGQIQIEKQQQLLKLGVNFDAVRNLEKQMTWARVGTIVRYYPQPTGTKANVEEQAIESAYRLFSMETTLENGKTGIKMFQFTDKPFPDLRAHQKEEQALSDHYGKPVQKVYFNGPAFMKLLKFRWVINIVATQEDSDQIERQLYVQNVEEAQRIFGPQSLNYEYIKEEWALKVKTDPSRFFLEDGGAGVLNMLQNQAGVGQPGGGGAGGGAPAPAPSGLKVPAPKLTPVKA